MTPCEKGRLFEEQASGVLEQEGYQIKRWFSKEKWTAPCDMLIEKDGKEIYCEVRGVTKEKTPIILSAQKMANLEALAEHTPVVLFLIRNGEHKIVPIEDLPKERYVSYPQKIVSSNYYRTLEQLEKKPTSTFSHTLRIELTGESEWLWWKWKRIKNELNASTNKEALIALVEKCEESKGRNIL